ncbi:hypothetical protein B0H13DRAFT_2271269 [Mycena leptocephala]|nr:hypothetical protein B0H13DRAFT_2271269 [Mycena leptocephala]
MSRTTLCAALCTPQALPEMASKPAPLAEDSSANTLFAIDIHVTRRKRGRAEVSSADEPASAPTKKAKVPPTTTRRVRLRNARPSLPSEAGSRQIPRKTKPPPRVSPLHDLCSLVSSSRRSDNATVPKMPTDISEEVRTSGVRSRPLGAAVASSNAPTKHSRYFAFASAFPFEPTSSSDQPREELHRGLGASRSEAPGNGNSKTQNAGNLSGIIGMTPMREIAPLEGSEYEMQLDRNNLIRGETRRIARILSGMTEYGTKSSIEWRECEIEPDSKGLNARFKSLDRELNCRNATQSSNGAGGKEKC